MPGGFDQGTPGVSVAGLVIAPWARVAPEEYSAGTCPTNEPIVRPVNRCQSPISTANANAVNVPMPRRHPSRLTTGVNSSNRSNRARWIAS